MSIGMARCSMCKSAIGTLFSTSFQVGPHISAPEQNYEKENCTIINDFNVYFNMSKFSFEIV